MTDSNGIRRGPDFICFGMQRAGTRWLYDQFRAHADVWMPPVKEIDHFVHNCFKPSNLRTEQKYAEHAVKIFDRAERDAFWQMFTPERRTQDGDDWYLDLFQPKKDRISGDISPEYAILSRNSARKVYRLCPGARYLMLIRDPVDRIWSAANFHLRKQRVDLHRLENATTVAKLVAHKHHVNRSHPCRIWRRWSENVPPSQLAFFFYDDIRDRPAETRARIFRFVGIDEAGSAIDPAFNRKGTQAKLPLNPAIDRNLTLRFLPEYEKCARIFGGRALEWLEAARRRIAGHPGPGPA